MGKIIWSPSSLEDIESIAEYISRDSKDQAALFILRLIEITDRLEQFPLSGRIIPEIGNSSCREIIYKSYRIMYRIEDKEIWITGIIHCSRDWKPEK
ncbi:type II toxin-antitoxin system RelE/ParE family toxin [Candidatus Sumerlaeota bacterium]|nr:type II toxin-antitoxin system RelE/ParE family toxin [Candidatus Sumerlaeota bacterium]